MNERELLKLKIETITLQHGFSVIIRLLEHNADREDIIYLARSILRIYPQIIDELIVTKRVERRESIDIRKVIDENKIKLLVIIKSGIQRASRLKRIIGPISEDDWRNLTNELIGDETIVRFGDGINTRYKLKWKEFF